MIEDISKTLYEMAEKKAKEEMDKFLQEKQNSLNAEVKELTRLLEEVENHVVYKRVDYKYVLVTKDILFEDFQKKGTSGYVKKIFYNDDFRYSNHYVRVSGEYYYHVGSIVQKHLEDIDQAIKLTSNELDKLDEKRRAVERIRDQHQNIIAIYNEYEKAIREQRAKEELL